MGKRIVGYELTFDGDVHMSLDDMWPDGVPETHTPADVRKLIAQDGGAAGVVNNWFLQDYLEVEVRPIFEPTPTGEDEPDASKHTSGTTQKAETRGVRDD